MYLKIEHESGQSTEIEVSPSTTVQVLSPAGAVAAAFAMGGVQSLTLEHGDLPERLHGADGEPEQPAEPEPAVEVPAAVEGEPVTEATPVEDGAAVEAAADTPPATEQPAEPAESDKKGLFSR